MFVDLNRNKGALYENTASRSALLDRLWEFDKISGEQTIKTHLTNLRRKLKKAGYQRDIVETIYGVGYRLSCLN